MIAHLFSTSEYERLCSFAPEIVAELNPGGPCRETNTDVRFGNKGALRISKACGAWYDFSAAKGGISVITLIQYLLSCDRKAAVEFAKNWLKTHPGTGSCGASGAEDDEDDVAAHARAEYARHVLSSAVPVIGTPGEKYLKWRGLEPPYPECVRYFADARLGEGAIVGILSSITGPIGVQLGYIDPDGRKTTVDPKRRVFLFERNAPEAFRVEVGNPVAGAPPIVITEGLEDALSVAQAKAASCVLGVPGVACIGALSRERLNAEVTVVRDGDERGSAADKALSRAVDALLLQMPGKVRVTATPPDCDANSVLREMGEGALRDLILNAPLAEYLQRARSNVAHKWGFWSMNRRAR